VAAITLAGLTKTYPNGHVAIRHLDLHIEDGEFLVLVGPSGCGKSTLLRLIAGLETPTAGRILIGDADVTAQPPQHRDLAWFQAMRSTAMSVRYNRHGLKVRRMDAATLRGRSGRSRGARHRTCSIGVRPSCQAASGSVALGRVVRKAMRSPGRPSQSRSNRSARAGAAEAALVSPSLGPPPSPT
jgi:ABC-type sugar transport system ATPase subunit